MPSTHEPGCAGSLSTTPGARTWGLALFIPADLFYRCVDQVLTRRQAALDAHYLAHPNRYLNGAPKAKRPPTTVFINPVTAHTAADTANSFKLKPARIEALPEVVTQKKQTESHGWG